MPRNSTPGTSAKPENNTLVGGLWMIAAGVCFAIMMGIIRHVADELHAFEIAFFRNLFGLMVMLPWIAKVGLGGLRTERLGLYSLRGLIAVVALMSWFYAVSIMPLTEAVALSFTAPLFATLLAALVLHEKVGIRRSSAMAVGFIGAMIILRPGVQVIGWGAIAVLISALAMSASAICIKVLSRTEPANAIVVYMGLFLTPLSLPPALFVWQTPTWGALGWMALLGAVASLGHSCYTRSFRSADASAVMPFDYVRLIFVALIGWFVFRQQTDLWTWVGAAVISAAGIYIAHREARVAWANRAAAATVTDRADR